MRIHELKCRDVYLKHILDGSKPFEVRRNDRDFEVGDYLALNEIQMQETGAMLEGKPLLETVYTGRCCVVRITYVLSDLNFCKHGQVVLGIEPCVVTALSRSACSNALCDLPSNSRMSEMTRQGNYAYCGSFGTDLFPQPAEV